MSFAQTTTRNRINPLAVSTVEQTTAPYATYDQVALCTDPNCPVCRAQRRDKRHKHHKRHHRHHRKHKNVWNTFLRTESPSTVSVHSIELDDRRAHYNTHVTERAVVPVNQTEQQVVSTTTNQPRYYRGEDDEVLRDAWVNLSKKNFFYSFYFFFRQKIILMMMKLFVVVRIMAVDVHVGVVLY